MVKLISFEGGIGSGKTSLTNYFSRELKIGKILEKYNINPFLKRFYSGDLSINFETEVTFLLIHFTQLKDSIKNCQNSFLIADFSIEKDLVFAELNLKDEELKIFKNLYDYIIRKVGIPYLVIYLDLSIEILKRRILQRGREYEKNADPGYFMDFHEKIKNFFKFMTKSKIWFINVDELELNVDNPKLKQIRTKIINEIQ
ncbi:MAG: hypothetical protein CEE42_00735 [Promethearchaeota archaeon Loki_b31]|nr:MAG: hypothetical protein CEE42_00735 [Candidatus Lokiarchaeota archaeon Loki_b31]